VLGYVDVQLLRLAADDPILLLLGYYGQAQKRSGDAVRRDGESAPDCSGRPPIRLLQEVYIPAIVYCGRLHTITSCSHAPLARPINIQLARAPRLRARSLNPWGSAVDTIAGATVCVPLPP